MKRILVILTIITALVLTACGGSSSGSALLEGATALTPQADYVPETEEPEHMKEMGDMKDKIEEGYEIDPAEIDYIIASTYPEAYEAKTFADIPKDFKDTVNYLLYAMDEESEIFGAAAIANGAFRQLEDGDVDKYQFTMDLFKKNYEELIGMSFERYVTLIDIANMD